MDKFTGVNVIKAANVYFDGKVTSRALEFADGSVKTLGIMLPGEYDFGTEKAERMEITDGLLQVRLPGSDDWREIKGGDSFDIPALSRFQLKVEQVTDYVCSYFDESGPSPD